MSVFLWVKVIHILAVISWMAGLLYLPRLLVYHSDQAKGSVSSNLFELMEFRLFRYIMRPAMVTAWLSGLWMGYFADYLSSYWFLVKLACVVLMTLVHEFLGYEIRTIAKIGSYRSAKFYRIVNELPTVIMIAIVILVITKPF